MTDEIKRSSLIWELAIVTVSLLVISHLLFIFKNVAWVGRSISTIVAIIFLYVPVVVLWKRGRRIDFLDRDLRSFLRSVMVFIVAVLVIFPPFLLAAHYWQLWVFGKHAFRAAAYPNLLNACVFQLLLVALPEEFYFRGYFQSTIDIVCKKRIRFLGVDVGWGFLITAAVFAVSHTIVAYQWWHFSIFFPALLFGYLRLRTGSITAPVLFHVASNVIMDWFARSYS
jgi:membrane protease YdiL (CAAX protease family)